MRPKDEWRDSWLRQLASSRAGPLSPLLGLCLLCASGLHCTEKMVKIIGLVWKSINNGGSKRENHSWSEEAPSTGRGTLEQERKGPCSVTWRQKSCHRSFSVLWNFPYSLFWACWERVPKVIAQGRLVQVDQPQRPKVEEGGTEESSELETSFHKNSVATWDSNRNKCGRNKLGFQFLGKK